MDQLAYSSVVTTAFRFFFVNMTDNANSHVPGETRSIGPGTNRDIAYRLNIFALPSRIFLLYLLILLVIFIPLIATLSSTSLVCAPFLLFWMMILPLRHFLRQPDNTIQVHDMHDAQESYPALAEAVQRAAQDTANVAPPHVLLSLDKFYSISVFGTFLRTYLAFSDTLAREMITTSQSTYFRDIARAQATILHEIAHIRHGAVWMVALARSVLVVTIGFMSLSLLVHWLSPYLYYRFLNFYDFRQPPMSDLVASLANTDPQILEALEPNSPIITAYWADYLVGILGVFVPLIVGSILLLIFFWSALLRTCELYADARVLEWQNGNSEPLSQALRLGEISEVFDPTELGLKEKTRKWATMFQSVAMPRLMRIQPWIALKPTDTQRRACLDAPSKIFGSDTSIALTAGVAVLLLNLSLIGQLYTATLPFLDVALTLGIGFLVISLSLLPLLCEFEGRLRSLFRKISKISLLFTCIELIPLLIGAVLLSYVALMDPSLLPRTWEASVRSMATQGIAGDVTALILEDFVIRPVILFAFFVPILLISCVFLDLWIKRRILFWFSADFLARYSRFVFLYITLSLAFLLIFDIAPIVESLTIPVVNHILRIETLIPMIIVGLINLGNVVLFAIFDRRFSRKCPFCGSYVYEQYELGMRCSYCGEKLATWLIVQSSNSFPSSK